jgi:hypothetical protein
MKPTSPSLDLLARPAVALTTIELGRGQFQVIKREPHDPAAFKKAMAKVRRISKTLTFDPGFDSVAEIRKYRDSVK